MATQEISAHLIAELQTQQIARFWKSSRPKPRNKAMGFKPISKEAEKLLLALSGKKG